MQSAGLALEHNLRTLGPKVLPIWEIILYVSSMVRMKVQRPGDGEGEKVKPYIPEFKRAFNHMCVHAGGKAVVRAVEKNLGITREMTEASYMTLYRFGNLSSASVWYELGYEEAKGWVKRGDKVWQIGLGSGFKCCSTVLKALKSVDKARSPACWADSIASLPVDLPDHAH
ncbi:hypothetical protein L7F22_025447 [Adiantum nelumboides]|nr:hypothetical protein [Adiantum nelumboides]